MAFDSIPNELKDFEKLEKVQENFVLKNSNNTRKKRIC